MTNQIQHEQKYTIYKLEHTLLNIKHTLIECQSIISYYNFLYDISIKNVYDMFSYSLLEDTYYIPILEGKHINIFRRNYKDENENMIDKIELNLNLWYKTKEGKYVVISFHELQFIDNEINNNHTFFFLYMSLFSHIHKSNTKHLSDIRKKLYKYELSKSVVILKVYILNRICDFELFINKTPSFERIFKLYNRHLKLKVLSDDELIGLFGEPKQPTITKITKLKPKKKIKNPLFEKKSKINTHFPPLEKVERKGVIGVLRTLNFPKETNSNTHNEIDLCLEKVSIDDEIDLCLEKVATLTIVRINEIEKPYQISFNIYYFFSLHDKQYISQLINNLYELNEKFVNLMKSYDYIRIIKTLHTDKNELEKSKHFNVVLYNTQTFLKSSQLHFYICPYDDKIISITTIKELL